MIQILYGPDSYSRRLALDALKSELDEDGMLSTSTSVFEGGRVSLEELAAACDTVPFLGKARLVVVEGLLGAFETRTEARPGQRGTAPTGRRLLSAEEQSKWLALAGYAARMPQTTCLVLVEEEVSASSNRLFQALRPFAAVREFPLPRGKALQDWVKGEAGRQDVELTPAAVAQLADLAGPNLELLAREIVKLGLYANGRAVTPEDVRLLSPHAREASVFSMVDAVVEGRSEMALRLLRELLGAGAPASYIMAMLIRQYRNLVQARDLLGSGMSPTEAGRQLGLQAEFVIRKVVDQANRYSPAALERALRRLLLADVAIKRGRLDEETSLELAVVDLCRRS